MEQYRTDLYCLHTANSFGMIKECVEPIMFPMKLDRQIFRQETMKESANEHDFPAPWMALEYQSKFWLNQYPIFYMR